MRGVITVLLAEDNVLVREGVRSLLASQPDLEVVGVVEDYDSLVAAADALAPHVVVTDIRMPPAFQREGIDAAQEIRRRHPGTAVVLLSQYDDPEYAVALLAEGSIGTGYLLKNRIIDGDTLAVAIRTVATGGTAMDPSIVDALLHPVTDAGDLGSDDEELLRMVAAGRAVKAIAAARAITPEAAADQIERLFVALARTASAGSVRALTRLRMLHQAIVVQKEQGETLSRLLPGGIAEKLAREGRRGGAPERVEISVLMSDIRSYSTIAEHADLTELAGQLNVHRTAMANAIIGCQGTVMQYIGDAVMAVFGAPFPQPDHADHAVAAAHAMHRAQAAVNERWVVQGLPRFELGIGISTGAAAAALLGSDERLEYTVVGDTVNLAQRLQQLADPGETVITAPTRHALSAAITAIELPPQRVKGRNTPVIAYTIPAEAVLAAPRD